MQRRPAVDAAADAAAKGEAFVAHGAGIVSHVPPVGGEGTVEGPKADQAA